MTVELDVFSGRENPRWTLTAQETARVEELLRGLPGAPDAPPPGLGFRGFRLEENGQLITVASGRVRISSKESDQVYRDANGLEHYLRELASEQGYGNLVGPPP